MIVSPLEYLLTFSTFRKEVDFGEGGKVLLSRLGDKVYATSAFCTHYGAPLAKGVLTADGRVVWYVAPSRCRIHSADDPIAHGMAVILSSCSIHPPFQHLIISAACFNVCTGDIGMSSCLHTPSHLYSQLLTLYHCIRGRTSSRRHPLLLHLYPERQDIRDRKPRKHAEGQQGQASNASF